MKSLLLFIFLICTGCDLITSGADYFSNAETLNTEPPLHQYKADLEITVGGLRFTGVAVANMADSIEVKIKSKVRLYLLSITTCSREFTTERADKNWFGGVGKDFVYIFKPNEVEKSGNCPMHVVAYDLKGIASWGIVHFKTNESLKAQVSCNGDLLTYNGLTGCQTRDTLIQRISFFKPIDNYAVNEYCGVERLSPLTFELRPKSGLCLATFEAGGEIHRAALHAYTKLFIRGE